MLFLFFKINLFVFSVLTVVLSLIFMVSVELFSKIEEIVCKDFFGSVTFSTVLEGRINFVNGWLYKNHTFFGPLLALLAAINTKTVASFFNF